METSQESASPVTIKPSAKSNTRKKKVGQGPAYSPKDFTRDIEEVDEKIVDIDK